LKTTVQNIIEALLTKLTRIFNALSRALSPQRDEKKVRKMEEASQEEPEPTLGVEPTQIAYTSNVGRIRAIDEDSIVVVDYSDSNESITSRKILAIVADGMGGLSKGEIASSLATKAISKSVFPLFHQRCIHEKEYMATLKEGFLKANAAIMEHALNHPECMGMGTTVSAAIVDNEKLYVGHVGDTRVYKINGNSIRQVTKDHSYVQLLLERGEITPEEARNHPRKNEITRAVGVGSKLEIDILSETLENRDYVLLCCDGLVTEVKDEEIMRIVLDSERLQDACDDLVDLANERGGRDNISVITMGPIRLLEPSEKREEEPLSTQPIPPSPQPMIGEVGMVEAEAQPRYQDWCPDCGQPNSDASAEQCPYCGGKFVKREDGEDTETPKQTRGRTE